MPWSLQRQARPARPASICARRSTRWCGTGCPDGGPDDFLGRLIRALNDEVRAGGGARARGRQCRDLLSRRPRDHRQCAHLDPLPALRAAGAAGARRRRRRRRRWRAGEDDAGPARAPAAAAPDPRGIDAPLSAGAALRPRRRSPPTGSATHEVAPGDIVSIWPWLLHRHRALWDDPDAFDPDRFAPEAKAEPPPLPVSPVRRRPAPLRRRALRHDRGADRARALAERAGVRADAGPRGAALGHGHAAARRGGLPLSPDAPLVLLPADVVAGDLPAGRAVLDQGREPPRPRLGLLRAGDPVEHDLAVAGRALLPIGPGRLVPPERAPSRPRSAPSAHSHRHRRRCGPCSPRRRARPPRSSARRPSAPRSARH